MVVFNYISNSCLHSPASQFEVVGGRSLLISTRGGGQRWRWLLTCHVWYLWGICHHFFMLDVIFIYFFKLLNESLTHNINRLWGQQSGGTCITQELHDTILRSTWTSLCREGNQPMELTHLMPSSRLSLISCQSNIMINVCYLKK